MRPYTGWLHFCVLTALYSPVLTSAAPPAWDFFRPAAVSSPQLSPDGKYVAFLRWEGTNNALFVLDIEARKQKPLPAGSAHYSWVTWANNHTLLFGLAIEGYETGGIYAVEAEWCRHTNHHAECSNASRSRVGRAD